MRANEDSTYLFFEPPYSLHPNNMQKKFHIVFITAIAKLQFSNYVQIFVVPVEIHSYVSHFCDFVNFGLAKLYPPWGLKMHPVVVICESGFPIHFSARGGND